MYKSGGKTRRYSRTHTDDILSFSSSNNKTLVRRLLIKIVYTYTADPKDWLLQKINIDITTFKKADMSEDGSEERIAQELKTSDDTQYPEAEVVGPAWCC